MTDPVPFALIAGVFGLLIGSFLNVCIYRWTRDLSVVRPRSACPSCNHPIAWYDNVPIMSYLLLRGRCRHCRERIAWAYPAVELLTGMFFAWFGAVDGPGALAAKNCLFAAILIGLIFSDLDTRLLPDQFTLGGLCAGLAFSLFVPLPPALFGLLTDLAGVELPPRYVSFGEALLGAFIPAGVLWLLGRITGKILGKEALGLGDVKMVAMSGAFLGIGNVLLTLMLGSLLGLLVALPLRLNRRGQDSEYLPFASYLGAAGLIVAANAFGVASRLGGLLGW
jgi:leader peptidase (prepilin peptidase)/N-methyltransferase